MLARGPTCLSVRKVGLRGGLDFRTCQGEAARIIKDKEMGFEHQKAHSLADTAHPQREVLA